jgi:death on curing protein
LNDRTLDLADFLLIAEAVLEIDADVLAKTADLGLADSALAAPDASFDGIEFYPSTVTKVAILCSRLVRNHPLPDGNKRVGYLCAIEYLERNGLALRIEGQDGIDDVVRTIGAIAAGTISEEDLAAWFAAHVVMA